ncbi:1178_t:CDS:1, partial [Entrophospora sp. SA101]
KEQFLLCRHKISQMLNAILKNCNELKANIYNTILGTLGP